MSADNYAHSHRSVVPGCFRCELSSDEVRMVRLEWLSCPICNISYEDDLTECFQKPDLFETGWVSPVANGWCAAVRLKWSE